MTDTSNLLIVDAEIVADAEIVLRRGMVREQHRTMRMILRTFADAGLMVSSDLSDDIDLTTSEYSDEIGRVFAFQVSGRIGASALHGLANDLLGIHAETDADLLDALGEQGTPTGGIITAEGLLPAVAFDFAEGWGDMTYDPFADLITSLYIAIQVDTR